MKKFLLLLAAAIIVSGPAFAKCGNDLAYKRVDELPAFSGDPATGDMVGVCDNSENRVEKMDMSNGSFGGKFSGSNQSSFVLIDTTTTSATFEDVASPLYVKNDWSPVGGSDTATRFAVFGITAHSSAGNIGEFGSAHYGGVNGYGYTNFAGVTDNFVIGLEGRCGAVLGNASVCAANVSTFDRNDENAGSIGIGVGYYLPDQADDGHIATKFSFFSDDSAWIFRNDGAALLNGGATVGTSGTALTQVIMASDAVASGQTSKAVAMTGVTASSKCLASANEVATNAVYIRAVVAGTDAATVTTSGDPGASNLDITVFCMN